MRILVLTSTFPRWAGDSTPRFVLDLSARLGEHHNVTVVAPHSERSKEQERIGAIDVIRFRYAPVRLEVLACEGGILAGLRQAPWRILLVPGFVICQMIAALRLLRTKEFDVVHAHWLIPQGLVAILIARFSRKRIRVLCTSHGGDLFALHGAIFAMFKRMVIQHCNAVTVVSSAMKRQLLQSMPDIRAKIYVAPMGADLDGVFTPDQSQRHDCTLLFVGRLAEKKGVATLLKSLPKVVARYPTVRLRVVGDGPMRDELKALAGQLGVAACVDWVGPLVHEKIVTEYRAATILVFPSVVASDGDQEGLGLVLVEAMGCNCPVIASDLPAVHDVIGDGSSGLLAKAGSPDDLARCILELLGDEELRNRLGVQGGQSVREKFGWPAVARRYMDIMEAIAVESRAEE